MESPASAWSATLQHSFSNSSSALLSILETLRDQEDERRQRVGSLVKSLLQACGGGSNKARERAQVTAHEALRQAKAFNARGGASTANDYPASLQKGGNSAHLPAKETNSRLEAVSGCFAERSFAADGDPNGRNFARCGDVGGGTSASVNLREKAVDDAFSRPISKFERVRADLMSAASHATK